MDQLVADGPLPDARGGVFETLLVRDGLPVELDDHVARLTASAGELYGVAPSPDAALALRAGAHGLPLGRVRLTVTPGRDGLVSSVSSAAVDPALVFPTDDPLALRAAVVERGLGRHKWADRRLVAALEEAAAPAVPLLVGSDRTVLEATRGNVFAVIDGVLVTPPLDGAILPGVARAHVLELAATLTVEVQERPLGHPALLAADEVFLSGSVRGIEPVGACGSDGRWPIGEVSRHLAAALRARWQHG